MMDVATLVDGGRPESLQELRAFLREKIRRECLEWYGVEDAAWIDRATSNWFNDHENYDRRWGNLLARRPNPGRVLDMAAGCGTFLLYGLNRGQDVWGIEPEAWKLDYYRWKVELSGYRPEFLGRMMRAVGEALPFADASFDTVTTYQTLEHVADVRACIGEILRVLKPGGVLYLKAPDYRCFYEPHYRLPFLPRMKRDWAEQYLRLLGRPTTGLRQLNWTSERQIVELLREQSRHVHIERNKYYFIEKRRQQVERQLPSALRSIGVGRVLNELHQARRQIAAAARVGRQERLIDLWVRKLAA